MVEVLRLAGADACLAGPAYPGAAGVGRLQALFLEDFEDALVAFDAQAQGAAAQLQAEGVGAAGRGRRRYWSVEAFEVQAFRAAAPGVADGLHQPVGSAAIEFFVGT